MCTATIEGNELVIRLPIERSISASGKSTTIASTRGNKRTELLDPETRKPVTIGVNAYVPR